QTALDAEKARDLINQYRADNGLKPLKLNNDLAVAAKGHARDLAKWDRISHYGSDGSNPWDRVKRTGFKARLAAENVGTGQVNFEEVLRGWKESAGHNKNLLLADATHMGIALIQAPNTEFKSFWTLVLGSEG
ncbi:MAG: CAP domain-containing protein, partial [Pseudomonadota bacterium]